VDVPFKMVLDRLPFATCTVDEYVAVYRTLENTWTTAGPQIQKAFATSKLLRIGVQRYTSPEVVWSDPSALLSKTPVIEAQYSSCKRFFTELLQVSVEPSMHHYMAELEMLQPLSPEQSLNHLPRIQKIYYAISHCLLTHPDCDASLLMTRKCFLTHRGHWITREQLLINDNPNTPEDLLSQSAIHFWNVPSNCLPKVQAITTVCEIPTLTSLPPIGGAPDPGAIVHSDFLTSQVRSLMPFMLRYSYFKAYEHYVRLKPLQKYSQMQVWTAKTLCATYQFNEVQWESPLPYFIKDDANEIHILISGDPAKVLPKALAECFGASPLTIQGMLSAQTGEKLNNMLVEMGMETLPESEGLQGAARSGSSAQATAQKRPRPPGGPENPPKKVCSAAEAPVRATSCITVDTPQTINWTDLEHVHSLPRVDTLESKNQLRAWGQEYVARVLQQSGVGNVQSSVQSGEPYDISFVKLGHMEYGAVHCTVEDGHPSVTLSAKQWQCAAQNRQRYHVFVVQAACSPEVSVTQLTDPCALVSSGKWPCTVTFSPQCKG